MKAPRSYVATLVASLGLATKGAGAQDEATKMAWARWRDGDVQEAESLARTIEEPAERTCLLCLCAFVSGRYDVVLEAIARGADLGRHRTRMEELALFAYYHQNRPSEAIEFIERSSIKGRFHAEAARRAARPLRSSLTDLSIALFAEHDLTDYFPAFSAEINGQAVVTHVDTGGSFLLMGPARAKELGIDTLAAGVGYHGSTRVKTYAGTAVRFRLGELRLENVPVTVLPSLSGSQDFIIFGTNVLEQALVTLDYPNKRLIMSPRGNEPAAAKHLALLAEQRVEVPFYLWEDHYMYVRGRFGDHRRLNFFVDSGLVHIVAGEDGAPRQAAFQSTPELFAAWGVDAALTKRREFTSPAPIAIGPLEQSGLLVMTETNPSYASLGDVRIDGLLSHAFLKQYAWTLDFDRRVFVFSGYRSK